MSMATATQVMSSEVEDRGSRHPRVPNENVNMRLLFDSAKYSDIKIKFAGHSIKAHSLVLKSGSKYFERLLEGPFKESQQDTIELKDDDPQALLDAIKWMYGFTYEPSQSLSAQLTGEIDAYIVSDKYEIELKENVLRLIVDQLAHCSPWRLWAVLLYIYSKDAPPQLLERVQNVRNMRAWELFKVSDFYDLCYSNIEQAAKIFGDDPRAIAMAYAPEKHAGFNIKPGFTQIAKSQGIPWLIQVLKARAQLTKGRNGLQWLARLLRSEKGEQAFKDDFSLCLDAFMSTLE